jgi:hypothetical protein
MGKKPASRPVSFLTRETVDPQLYSVCTDYLHIRRREKSWRDGEEAPKGSVSSSSPGACPAELTHMASEATAGAATEMIIGVDEKQSDDGPIASTTSTKWRRVKPG